MTTLMLSLLYIITLCLREHKYEHQSPFNKDKYLIAYEVMYLRCPSFPHSAYSGFPFNLGQMTVLLSNRIIYIISLSLVLYNSLFNSIEMSLVVPFCRDDSGSSSSSGSANSPKQLEQEAMILSSFAGIIMVRAFCWIRMKKTS